MLPLDNAYLCAGDCTAAERDRRQDGVHLLRASSLACQLGNAPSILDRSYTITAEVDVPQGGGDGMIATAGGRWGGCGLYMLKGKPVFDYNMLILAAIPVGRRAGTHSRQARLSCSTTPMTALALRRAAPAC